MSDLEQLSGDWHISMPVIQQLNLIFPIKKEGTRLIPCFIIMCKLIENCANDSYMRSC